MEQPQRHYQYPQSSYSARFELQDSHLLLLLPNFALLSSLIRRSVFNHLLNSLSHNHRHCCLSRSDECQLREQLVHSPISPLIHLLSPAFRYQQVMLQRRQQLLSRQLLF